MKGKSAVGLIIIPLVLLLTVSLACAKAPLKLEDVKGGRITPEEYLGYLAENILEIKETKRAGLTKGILYNPSGDELKSLLSDLLEEKAPDQDLEWLLSENLKSFQEQKEGHTAFGVLPSTTTLVAKNYPLYIIGFPQILDSAETDGDVENMLLHELQHIKDLYWGVKLNGHHITWQEFEEKAIRGGVLEELAGAPSFSS